MKSQTTLAAAPAQFAGVEAVIHRIVDGLRRLKAAYAERRARARARDELDTLDAHALRDLGLSRSEFDSYLAEAWHEVEATRVRSGAQRPMEYGP
jgi:uncharacterized protein YjiS (DUF1127 family)